MATMDRRTKRLMVAFTILFGSIAMPLVSAPAHATHPAAGTCKHTYDPHDTTYSVCKKGTLGNACERDGAGGRCGEEITFPSNIKLDSITGTLSPVGGFSCFCVRVKGERQAAQPDRAARAAQTASDFDAVASALGSTTAACAQLNNLLIEILRAISGVVGYGSVQTFSTKSLNDIDTHIKNYANLDNRARNVCSLTPPNLSSVMTTLEAIKQQISASRISKEPD